MKQLCDASMQKENENEKETETETERGKENKKKINILPFHHQLGG
jgi:hypothetical protein